ncbi:MAG: hypothetical protein R3E79_12765 [Caldilineaceae bacterium]
MNGSSKRALPWVEAQAARGCALPLPPQADAATALAGRFEPWPAGNPGLQRSSAAPFWPGELDGRQRRLARSRGGKGRASFPRGKRRPEFFQRLAFATYKDALTESQRTQLRAATLFSENLPVPLTALPPPAAP